MAGFFGLFDYTKPGPGVPKDAPPKAGILVFLEIFTRKFWNLVKINMMFFLFNLPAMLLALIGVNYFVRNSMGGDILYDVFLKFALYGAILVCIPLITVGPAQAGLTYILRNYAREEHAFIWWDFKEHALKNFKQSMVICGIDFLVMILVGFDINIYMTIGKGNFLITLASGFLILSFVIYLMMHMYIYPMLVTFKLSTKQIYKNALIFAIIKFFPNLGILLLCTLLVVISFYLLPLGYLLMFLITMSTIGLITNFYVYPKLKKYIMDKVEQQEEETSVKVMRDRLR